MKHTRLLVLATVVAALGTLLVACSDSSPATTATRTAEAMGDASMTPSAEAMQFDFPTGPAVLVANGYEPPEDHVPSTGAYLPVNGKPTLVFVDAIWCPSCALTRPIFHKLREEYQDQVNLVILDYDLDADGEFAGELGVRAHPAWAVIAPDSDEVLERRFGPLQEAPLRKWLAEVIAGTVGDGA
jgi:thiol-disulfide isomerase/thioredoxin